ncbi:MULTISPECIES: DUF1772 domain-containing protein [Haloferax]|uniref:DUF1772 domain-containing protein n=2 Tax=Haloferax TaxID=2251 RepID=A0A6G1YXY0_9EURY|nr:MULTISPECIES: anthrone oxygenase family protein [Haloferax]KAB1186532.1 DUF1772 domain-containing protein [Haloferax sp. CBA1149]MRW79142.1 DUF1772 domain-containing protein [Haloferax marinisediminis]
MVPILQVSTLLDVPVVFVLAVSAVLGGLMAGFFFAYSVSVVLALETLSSSEYTNVMQEINEKVLNALFGVVFFSAAVVPLGGAAVLVLHGDWQTFYGQLYLAGTVIYLAGAFFVTARIHIPMNEHIATWSPVSPPEDWAAVRARWTRWNHVRTTAAVASFALYLAAVASFGA